MSNAAEQVRIAREAVAKDLEARGVQPAFARAHAETCEYSVDGDGAVFIRDVGNRYAQGPNTPEGRNRIAESLLDRIPQNERAGSGSTYDAAAAGKAAAEEARRSREMQELARR